MKTFEEIKKETLKAEKEKIANAQRNLQNPTLDAYDKSQSASQIKTSTFLIENIDEIVSIYIAATANILIEEIKNSSQCNGFYEKFHNSLSDFLYAVANLSIDKNGNLTPDKTKYLIHNSDIQRAVTYLGLTLEDLQFLQGKTIDSQVRDEFVRRINANFGTDIPMTHELIETQSKLDSTQPLKIEWHEAIKDRNLTRLRNGHYIGRSIPTLLKKDILASFNQAMNELYRNICDSLSEDEKSEIINMLENKECSTCQNKNCKIEQQQPTIPHHTNCQDWYNTELIGKSKILKITDIHKLTSSTVT